MMLSRTNARKEARNKETDLSVKLVAPLDDVNVEPRPVVVVKGHDAREQDVRDHTHCPQVNLSKNSDEIYHI